MEYWPRSKGENEHHPTISNQVETVLTLWYCCFLASVVSSSYWAPCQGQRLHNRGRAQKVPGYNLSSQTDRARRTSREQLGKCQLQIHTHRSLANSLKQYNMCFIQNFSPVANESLILKYSPTATTAGTYTNPKPIPANSP